MAMQDAMPCWCRIVSDVVEHETLSQMAVTGIDPWL